MVVRLRKLTAAAGRRLAVMVSRLAAAGGDDECDEETSARVAILVIDDFGLKKQHVNQNGQEGGESVAEEGEDAVKLYCTDAADGQVFAAGGAVFAAGGAASTLVNLTDAKKNPLFHGDLVWMKVLDVLGQVTGAQEIPKEVAKQEQGNGTNHDEAGLPHESVWCVQGNYVHVVAVDTEGFDTGTIRDRIVKCIDLLKNKGVHRFVLNMSFAIIPCEPMEKAEYNAALTQNTELSDLKDLLQKEKWTPEQIREELDRLACTRTFYKPLTKEEQEGWLKKDEEQTGWELKPDFLEKIENDAMLEFFQDPSSFTETVGKKDIINVAAAGNAGRNYPYAPAIWKNVLSVSAGDVHDQHQPYSNDGEVIAYDIVEVEHKDKDGGTIPVHGTSFAAPEVSVRAALYLAQGGSAECDGKRPPLAYADENGTWEKLPLKKAKEKHCKKFDVDLS